MPGIERTGRAGVAALIAVFVGGCAGNQLSDVLGNRQVDQTANGSASTSVPSSGTQLLRGTVRQVDRRNGLFMADVDSAGAVAVTLPYNPRNADVARFNNLRSGDVVQFYGTYLSSIQIQLRRFY
ncbi:MAG: hypothetical protein ACJ8AJ_02410 [Gemmatimonadaceae bacterium]